MSCVGVLEKSLNHRGLVQFCDIGSFEPYLSLNFTADILSSVPVVSSVCSPSPLQVAGLSEEGFPTLKAKTQLKRLGS